MFLFLKELCDPEKWKECQIPDDNLQYRGSSLVPDCTVGSKKHGDWKERDQGGGMCGNLLKLWCFLSLKMFVLEWVSQKKSRGQEWPNKVGMGSSLLHHLGQPFASTIPLDPHGSTLGVVLLAALDCVESKLRDTRQLFQGKPVTKHTIKDFKLKYAWLLYQIFWKKKWDYRRIVIISRGNPTKLDKRESFDSLWY